MSDEQMFVIQSDCAWWRRGAIPGAPTPSWTVKRQNAWEMPLGRASALFEALNEFGVVCRLVPA